VNGFVARTYNKVATSLMEIVKFHLSVGSEESQEMYNPLLLVFMKLFEANASSFQVYSVTGTLKCSVSNLLTGLIKHTHIHTHIYKHIHIFLRKQMLYITPHIYSHTAIHIHSLYTQHYVRTYVQPSIYPPLHAIIQTYMLLYINTDLQQFIK
jgi:hypothetical protein